MVAPVAYQGRTNEAISYFKKAIEIRPDYARAHYNLGNAMMQKQKYDKAISSYQMAIALKPNYAQAHDNLKIALSKQ